MLSSVSVGEGLPSSELSHSMLASLEKLLNEKARKEGRDQVNIAAPSGLVNTHSIVSGAQLRCPAGYQCMPDLTMDVFLIASVGVGACSPCVPGTYCPQGSMNDDGLLFGSATVNLCPPGFYCPDPTQIVGCPAGYFCPSGSVRPYSCANMTFQGASLKGNFCPSYSPTPFGVCRAGHYCPDASQKIVCPRGYFCPPQSVEPQKCPPLSACNAQKRRPEVSFSAVIGILTVIFGLGALVLLYSWWLRRMQARKLDRSRKEGRKWTLMKTLGAKLGATSDQMASISKYNSFSANVTQINVVVENLQPSEGATKLSRRHRMRRRRGVLDERVEQQETARREQSRELREHLSLQEPRHVDEVPRPGERCKSGGEVSLRANRRLDGHARLGRHLMPIE